MKRTMTMASITMLLAATAYADGVTMKEGTPGLLKKAKIAAAAATATAQAKVPKGKIVSAEIEEENGKLIFSFDVRTEGKTGIDEINVDAINGKVLSAQHETQKDEVRENAEDRKRP